jgi:hypothetical protein
MACTASWQHRSWHWQRAPCWSRTWPRTWTWAHGYWGRLATVPPTVTLLKATRQYVSTNIIIFASISITLTLDRLPLHVLELWCNHSQHWCTWKEQHLVDNFPLEVVRPLVMWCGMWGGTLMVMAMPHITGADNLYTAHNLILYECHTD